MRLIEGQQIGRLDVHGDGYSLLVDEEGDFLQRPIHALAKVRLLKQQLPLDFAGDAQLEHGVGHAGDSPDARFHPLQDFLLFRRQGPKVVP